MVRPRLSVENPTPDQERLLAELEGLARLECMLASPMDLRFLPDDQIDSRRLAKVRRRLLDECRVIAAAVSTELAREENVTVQ